MSDGSVVLTLSRIKPDHTFSLNFILLRLLLLMSNFVYYCPDFSKLPLNRVVPEKPKGPQLVKKFSAFYGNRWFITAFTRARLLFLTSVSSRHTPVTPLEDPF
jgi:hypothetical protein